MFKLFIPKRPAHSFVTFSLIHSVCLSLEESVRAAVESRKYRQIPDLFIASKESCQASNPFSFMSTFSLARRTQVIDEMLQDFIWIRPRYHPYATYSCLLTYVLQSPDPLPLGLAIVQRVLRSGCVPVPQTHLLLSSAWMERRQQCESVSKMLLEMESIGYGPDCGTCNYLISSLCKVDQSKEAVQVLRGMCKSGCVPDLDTYGIVIGAMCRIRRITVVAELMREMVKFGLTPRQEIVVKVIKTMKARKDVWRAVEVIELLQTEGILVGFESYESVLEGCLECGEYVLAGKVVMGMTNRGFIPYIRARQKVVEGLANAGDWKFAYAVRQRFTELKS